MASEPVTPSASTAAIATPATECVRRRAPTSNRRAVPLVSVNNGCGRMDASFRWLMCLPDMLHRVAAGIQPFRTKGRITFWCTRSPAHPELSGPRPHLHIRTAHEQWLRGIAPAAPGGGPWHPRLGGAGDRLPGQAIRRPKLLLRREAPHDGRWRWTRTARGGSPRSTRRAGTRSSTGWGSGSWRRPRSGSSARCPWPATPSRSGCCMAGHPACSRRRWARWARRCTPGRAGSRSASRSARPTIARRPRAR